jgi:uroporphyrinogen decarboxylase
VPLIGFSGSPWTLACYMVEGGGSDDFSQASRPGLNEPAAAAPACCRVVTDAVIAYLSAQHAAGAQALQVFDTWGGVLSPAMYREFSLPYLVRIARELNAAGLERTPLILFGKGNAPHLEDSPPAARRRRAWTGPDTRRGTPPTGARVALQGNLDPAMLYARPDAIRISPDVDPEHLKALIDAVHALSWPYHE